MQNLMTVEKRGAGFFVEFKGGQAISGGNFFFIAKQIKERFDFEVSAIQLKKLFDKNQ